MSRSKLFESPISGVVTAIIAFLPDWTVSYLGKLVSVFILAIAAESGRKLIGKVWK